MEFISSFMHEVKYHSPKVKERILVLKRYFPELAKIPREWMDIPMDGGEIGYIWGKLKYIWKKKGIKRGKRIPFI